MSQRVDIDSLQALCAVVDQGGVTRAAHHLALSQSAVSHKIRRMEDRLGRALLDRRPGPEMLTQDGARLLGYARRIVALHDEALQSLSSCPLSGRLRLGMTEDTTSSGLSRILGRFARLHPDVSVRTHVDQSLVLEGQLDRGEIDLVIMQIFRHRLLPGDDVLFEDSLHWVKSRDLIVDIARPLPFLAFDEDCFYRNWAIEQGTEQGVQVQTVLECASTAGIVSGVLAGLGVALLNARHLTPEMDVIDTDFGMPPPGIAYVVRIGRKSRSRIAQALAQAITDERHPGARLGQQA